MDSRAELCAARNRRGLTALGLVLALAFTSFAAVSASGQTIKRSPTCATLGEGTTGPAVMTIQKLVGADPDGDFGPLTKAAVAKWQRRHKLDRTGAVDAATWAKLPADVRVAACAQQVHDTSADTVTCAHLSQGSTGPAVEVLQKAVGADVDGEFGPHTAAAVQTKQRKAKLRPTGVVGPVTWAALGLTGTPACVAVPVSVSPTPQPKPAPKPSAHDLAVQKIRDQVQQLAAELLDAPTPHPGPLAARVVAFAKAQHGKPYKWGGAGPKAYDCSGLVMSAYLHAGMTLPRVAADQYGAGVAEPLNAAHVGDLLFYASDLTRPSTIHHVVIYVGDGRIIDAPYTGAYVGVRPLWTQGLLPVAIRPLATLHLPLHAGESGPAVGQLQQALNRHGFSLTVDGGFGPSTLAAVKAWKQKHKLNATGVVGYRAWLTL